MSVNTTNYEGKSQDISFHSDYYKDAYGFRPRGFNYDNWTEADFQQEFKNLEVIIQADIAEQKVAQEAQIEAFKALIQKTIELGAGDEETALRWIFEADNQWDDYFAIEGFTMSYGFDYTDYGRAIEKQLLTMANNQLKLVA